MQPALVILAAGASTRLGQPKALVDLEGRSALEHLVAAWGVPDEAWVVSGAHHEAIQAALPVGVQLLHTPRWREGRSSGLALAAGHLRGRDLLVAPVDCPLVPASVLEDLAAEWASSGAPARGFLAPYWVAEDGQRRFGHPIVLGRELARELVQGPPEASLRDLRQRAEPLAAMRVSSPAILDNLDTPDELARLRQRLRAAASDGQGG